jgi:hypothetical protein
VTRRAVFGDFLGAARHQLGPAGAFREAVWAGGYVAEIRHSLLRVLVVMSRYVQDASVVPASGRSRRLPAATGWDRAGAEAREAMTQAVVALHGDAVGRRGAGVRAGSELTRLLEATAGSLTYGRDLLQTHLAQRPDGGRQFRSEWGTVLASPPVRHALLAEMESLAQQLSWLEEGLERSPRARGSPEERRRMKAACHWLRSMHTSIRLADREEPVPAADRELLWAVPVNARPVRRLPEGREPVSALCAGMIETAERVRHAAWLSEREPAWSPRVTVNSLRQVAAANTITSHHCEIVLRSLADGVEDGGDRLRLGLVQAAEAAGRARTRWLAVACALDHVTTDTQEHLSQAAMGANDLALWTGRLAYADPSWTVASGPSRDARPARNLAHGPEELPRMVEAVYQAVESMTRLALADHKQVRAAANAGRILVAAGPESNALDMVLPFSPAPPERIDAMLSQYQYAAKASAESTCRTSGVTTVVQAPGRGALTSAAPGAGPDRSPVKASEAPAGQRVATVSAHVPGPIERALRELGITDVDLLRRGVEIDRAGEQLIVFAAARQSQHRLRGSTTRSRAADVDEPNYPVRHSREPRFAVSARFRRGIQQGALEAEP